MMFPERHACILYVYIRAHLSLKILDSFESFVNYSKKQSLSWEDYTPELFKKFSIFYKTQSFIAMFTSALSGPCSHPHLSSFKHRTM
jgi:hypothetical protein